MCFGPTTAAIVLVQALTTFVGGALLSTQGEHGSSASAAVQQFSRQPGWNSEEDSGEGDQGIAHPSTVLQAGQAEHSDFERVGLGKTSAAFASQQLPGAAVLLMMVALLFRRRH